MDGTETAFEQDGQEWRVAWHPPPEPPQGTPHGAQGSAWQATSWC